MNVLEVAYEKESTDVNVGKGGVNVDVGQYPGTTVGVGKGGVDVNTGHGTTVNVGHGTGVGVQTHHGGKPVYVYVAPGKSPFSYVYAATATQVHDDPSAAFFFLENNLRPGTKMNTRFYNLMPASTFLPRDIANSLPFSTSKTAEILSKYSIEPTSTDATAIKETLKTCESPAAKGEDRLCVTSLESMVDFAISKLGKDAKVVATEAAEDSHIRTYTVAPEGAQELKGSKSVTCHREAYAYAVYYCHETYETSAYTVPLVRDDGSKAEAVAVCHKDTSAWNPKHLAFQVLKVKPGTVPVCHFLPQDHLVWVSSS